MEEKKRKQHYVYQAYLKAWTTNDKIWCSRDRNEPFYGSTERIANRRDFYRLKPLNVDEELFYRFLIKKYSPEVQNALLNHLSSYIEPFKWQYQLEFLKSLASFRFGDNVPDELEAEIARLEKFVDVSINNIEENFLSEIESESISWLESLKKGSAEFYYSNIESYSTNEAFDDEAYHFLFFLCVQMFRTTATKERWIAGFSPSLNDSRLKEIKISSENINLENLAPHFLWEIQNLLAYSLRKNKAHLTILVNSTDIPFITSDQPVINLKADYSSLSSETTELVLYYPLSPSIAITVNDSNEESEKLLTREETMAYNVIMLKASFHEIYSSSKDEICRLMDITAPPQNS